MAEQEPHAAQTEGTSEGVPSRVPIWDIVRYYLRLARSALVGGWRSVGRWNGNWWGSASG